MFRDQALCEKDKGDVRVIRIWISLFLCFLMATGIWAETFMANDKCEHWMAGWGQQALMESYGYTPDQARKWVFLTALAWEGYCYAKNPNDVPDPLDVLANLFGSYTFELAEGINFKLVIK
jgi:hypothetical protein